MMRVHDKKEIRSYEFAYHSETAGEHTGPFRVLPNGETACDGCCHVSSRADGTPVTYEKPNPVAEAPEDETTAGETTVEEGK